MFKILLAVIRFVVKALENVHTAREVQIAKTMKVMAKLADRNVAARVESTAAIKLAETLKGLVS